MKNPLLNVTLPVFNAEGDLRQSFGHLRAFLGAECPFPYEIVIANNGSTDRTIEIARSLVAAHRDTRVLNIEWPGRGRAIREAWGRSTARILTYMDIDLSTDLSAFPMLIGAIASGNFDLATGSRLLPSSATRRSWRREAISRCYNRILRFLLSTRFSDAQCGFKAISRELAQQLLPLILDQHWFFDSELLVLAERCGCRILDVPVRWIENPDTSVKLVRTAVELLRGILRLRKALKEGRYARVQIAHSLNSGRMSPCTEPL